MANEAIDGHVVELDDVLSRIRAQSTSKLENQKHVAIILAAVEENIGSVKNVVNYLVSFMSLLDQAVDPQSGAIKDLGLATSTAYLLDIVFQYCPPTLLRSKFSEILTKIAPIVSDTNARAPLIRSGIGCLQHLLIAQDAQGWNNTHNLAVTPMRGLRGILELSLDGRPKIRKRAQDAIIEILSHPPPAPTSEHVASPAVASFTLNTLSNALQDFSSISKRKNGTGNEQNNRIIHCLKLIATLIPTGQWPTSQIEPLCDMLLEVIKSTDQYLVSSSFQCFEQLFKTMAESNSTMGLAGDKCLQVLSIIFSLKPSNKDTHLATAWISVVLKGVTAYANEKPLNCLVKLPEIFKILATYLSSEIPEVCCSVSQCMISILTTSVKDELLLYPPQCDTHTYDLVDDTVKEISNLMLDFLSIKYVHSAREVLNIMASMLTTFKSRCNPFFMMPLSVIDQWRLDENNYQDYRNEVELVMGRAISVLGPEVILEHFPLNLENPSSSKPGRAWLLPIMSTTVRNAQLGTFINQMLPLVTYFESKYKSLPVESIQLKVFETVVDQIWATLPRFCDLPIDLEVSFTDEFASNLSSMLYSKVHLRPIVCNSLKILAESNKSYKDGAFSDDLLLQQRFPVSKAESSLSYLSSKASNILAVLFNVYTQTAPNARGYILEAIEAYLKITSPTDIEKTFNNVCGLLKKALDEESQKIEKGKPHLSATLLDLVVCMTKYLPEVCYNALFSIFGSTVKSGDALTQKRAYRIITRLSELEAGSSALANYVEKIADVIVSQAASVQTSSKASRLAGIKTLVHLLPPSQLHYIVSIVSEVILGTKDVNEKSRELAFETLIEMCNKMNTPGGTIKLSKLSGYDKSSPDQPSTLTEFFKIISAGLIGESQHMVSSTITAYACLVFEFKDQIENDVLMEIYDTIELYLTSNSREIVKSAIGFAKVCVLGLPTELMQPKVPGLLQKLLRWSHEHTGHFKAKVKHIIERLIRRFGYDYIEEHFPEEDKKLLSNIRKTRNRNKRKVAEEGGDEATSQLEQKSNKRGSRFMSAFDEAVYDSSDNEGDDDVDRDGNGRKNRGPKQFIVESAENPLDLLDAESLAHISSTRPKKFNNAQAKRKINGDAYSFDADGKLIVKGETAQTAHDDDPLKAVTSGVNAYLEAVSHGPVRGQRNKLKFKKGNRAGNQDDDEEGDFVKRSVKTNNKVGKGQKKFKSRRKL